MMLLNEKDTEKNYYNNLPSQDSISQTKVLVVDIKREWWFITLQ